MAVNNDKATPTPVPAYGPPSKKELNDFGAKLFDNIKQIAEELFDTLQNLFVKPHPALTAF